MNTISCLALIIYMESRGEPIQTQQYVAATAINIAEKWNKSICDSIKIPKIYSWQWDGVNAPIKDKTSWQKCLEIAKRILQKRFFL